MTENIFQQQTPTCFADYALQKLATAQRQADFSATAPVSSAALAEMPDRQTYSAPERGRAEPAAFASEEWTLVSREHMEITKQTATSDQLVCVKLLYEYINIATPTGSSPKR